MKKYTVLTILLMLAGCGGIENEKLDTKNEIEKNKLLIPPCER